MPLEDVESAADICKRFSTGAMSYHLLFLFLFSCQPPSFQRNRLRFHIYSQRICAGVHIYLILYLYLTGIYPI
eukprot:COSAG05_NODE_886_length_6751_cov_151.638906_3_plen_73_part_00